MQTREIRSIGQAQQVSGWPRSRPPAVPPSRIAARALRGFIKSYFRDCPRDENGRCLPRSEAGRSGRPGGLGAGEPGRRTGPQPRPRSKAQGRLARFRTTAVRRRVLHGLRNEKLLADAINALNLPDSEPADVVFFVNPDGEIVFDRERLTRHLQDREMAVGLLKLGHWGPDGRPAAGGIPVGEATLDAARRILATPLIFFEVKTLITSRISKIRMSEKAVARKLRWSERYAAQFVTVAFDDRRGHKHSGHHLYYRRGVGTFWLEDMEPAPDYDDILQKATGGVL